MRHSASRRLVMAACATAMVSVVMATEADASGRHVRTHRHHRTSIGFNDPPAGAIAPAAMPVSRGNICPGNARAIDCTVWPPPFDDDPDRKATSSDGGG